MGYSSVVLEIYAREKIFATYRTKNFRPPGPDGPALHRRMPTELSLDLIVNGEPVRRLVAAHRTLLELLRDELDLTGSKHGCDVGDCGACTVLLDGQPRLSCITLAAEAQGRAVRTVEGLAREGRLTPIQDALHRHVAAQCGYCTPGIAMCLTALHERPERCTEADLQAALGANICRCTGYTKILAAAREVLLEQDDEPLRAWSPE
jgi:aerobic-type carbon monoxide dehydrogenase small subunit (CoxS/CutS family)